MALASRYPPQPIPRTDPAAAAPVEAVAAAPVAASPPAAAVAPAAAADAADAADAAATAAAAIAVGAVAISAVTGGVREARVTPPQVARHAVRWKAHGGVLRPTPRVRPPRPSPLVSKWPGSQAREGHAASACGTPVHYEQRGRER